MKNIVWLASYPKSGNTWFRMFLSNYLGDKDEPATLNEIYHSSIVSAAQDFEEELGLNPFEMYGDEVDLYRPELFRILLDYHTDEKEPLFKKVHDAYTLNSKGEEFFPGEVSKAVLYFIRNPLDVCVSYANHIPVLAIRFIGLSDDPDRIKKAIEFARFDRLKDSEKKDGFNEKMQLCENFFWKGKSGYYRDHLTQEQIDQIIESEGEVIRAFDYIDKNGDLTI
ncbi:MAG: sulfotransferase domain-containing protein [Bacteroidota bacterium]|nr:sulfotransferase domain-containing protein [Bacteroidota bacterium]